MKQLNKNGDDEAALKVFAVTAFIILKAGGILAYITAYQWAMLVAPLFPLVNKYGFPKIIGIVAALLMPVALLAAGTILLAVQWEF